MVVQWGNLSRLVNVSLMSCENNLSRPSILLLNLTCTLYNLYRIADLVWIFRNHTVSVGIIIQIVMIIVMIVIVIIMILIIIILLPCGNKTTCYCFLEI